MQKIKQLYRTDYNGETIVKDLIYSGQGWSKNVEHVPNNVINDQISNKAVILGNGPSRLELNSGLFTYLDNHKGGLLAAGRLQTYGCNALIRDYTPDFLIANGTDIIKEMSDNNYATRTITYADSDAVLDYPGKFYLIPQNPSWDAGAIAAYLACFDGHKTVYLLGFDTHSGEADHNYNVYAGTNGYATRNSPNQESFFSQTLLEVMTTYSDVDFVRVMPTETYYMPESWKYQLNLRQIDFRAFTLEVDL